MANRYGPWATMIDLAGSPQLSTFWRRRLTMLVPTSQSSSLLSRRTLLWLGAAAVLMTALPLPRVVMAQSEAPQRAAKQTLTTEKQVGLKKPSDQWGPDRNGLRTRLLPAQTEYTVGRPARFRLEMKNFGKTDRKFDSQSVDVNGSIRISGPDRKPVRYVAGGFQTGGHSRSIAPAETVVLFDKLDLADQYVMVKPGMYTLQFRGTNVIWDSESGIPSSAEVTIEMRPGKAPASMQVPARLAEIIPAKWALSLNGRVYEVENGKISPPGWESGRGTFVSLIPPSGSKRYPLSVRVWIAERRLAWTGTRPFWVGKEKTQKEVTPAEAAVYLGKGTDGHVYWNLPKQAETQWPDIRAKIKSALRIELPEPQAGAS
jgi:hypothetical protein